MCLHQPQCCSFCMTHSIPSCRWKGKCSTLVLGAMFIQALLRQAMPRGSMGTMNWNLHGVGQDHTFRSHGFTVGATDVSLLQDVCDYSKADACKRTRLLAVWLAVFVQGSHSPREESNSCQSGSQLLFFYIDQSFHLFTGI